METLFPPIFGLYVAVKIFAPYFLACGVIGAIARACGLNLDRDGTDDV